MLERVAMIEGGGGRSCQGHATDAATLEDSVDDVVVHTSYNVALGRQGRSVSRLRHFSGIVSESAGLLHDRRPTL